MLLETSEVVPVRFVYPCRTICRNTCDLSPACRSLHETHGEQLPLVRNPRILMRRGDHLYSQGDPATSLYVLRSGSMKNYISTPDGSPHVVRFHLPGDVIALDAMGSEDYPSSVQALEPVSICQIANPAVMDELNQFPQLSMHLLKLASAQVLREQRRSLMLSQRDAAERLALFLLELSARYKKRGLPQYEFALNMTRGDIASYLALTIETVSRMFTQFQNLGLISCKQRRIHLASPGRLKNMTKTRHLYLVQ